MNTLELENASKNVFIRKSFIGVFASDLLPDKPIKQLPFSLIVNTCKTTEKGLCHWIGIFKDIRGVLHFFDSGGNTFNNHNHIKLFVKTQKPKKIWINIKQVQDQTSDRCGKFVLAFLHAKNKKISNKKFLSLFNFKNLKSNDQIVDKIYKFILREKK